MKRVQPALFAATGLLYVLPLGFRALWDSDEGRYAEIAREMLEGKDWIAPHLNYVLYFEKPPLVYWLTAMSMAIFGQNPFAARLWCVVFAIGTVWIVYQAGQRWRGARAGLIAAGITASTLGFFIFSQFLVLDMALTFWLMGTLAAGMDLFKNEAIEPRKRMVLMLGVCLGGGLLTKGPVAMLMTLPMLAIVGLWTQRTSTVFWRGLLLAFVLGLAIAAPWYVMVIHRYPFFARFFFIHEQITRYFTNVHHRNAPFYFFVPVIIGGFLPWSVFLPAVVTHLRRIGLEGLRRDPGTALWIFWSTLMFLFFSASHSKLVTYALPILPAMALLIAERFDAFWEKPAPPWLTHGLAALIAILCGIIVFLKWPSPAGFMRNPGMQAFLEQGGPLYAALAFFVFAAVGVRSIRKTPTAVLALIGSQVAIFLALVLTLPALSPFRSTAKLAEILNERAQPNEKVVVYGVSYENVAQTLPFYLRKRIAVYGDPGELAFGLEHAPDSSEWIAAPNEATAALQQLPRGSWVVTDLMHWKAVEPTVGDLLVLVEKQGRLCLLQKVV